MSGEEEWTAEIKRSFLAHAVAHDWDVVDVGDDYITAEFCSRSDNCDYRIRLSVDVTLYNSPARR